MVRHSKDVQLSELLMNENSDFSQSSEIPCIKGSGVI